MRTVLHSKMLSIHLLTPIMLLLFLLSLLVPSISEAAKTRIRVAIRGVPTPDAITIELYISWGAKHQNPLAEWKTYHEHKLKGGRNSGNVTFTIKSIKVPSNVSSFVCYGRITNTQDKSIIRYFPAQFSDVEGALDQIDLDIITYKTFTDTIRGSYPFQSRRYQGFLTASNVRQSLRATRLMLEYAGQTGTTIDGNVWDEIHLFFNRNREFFRSGGSSELSEVLIYLATYNSIVRDPGFALFYAEFLNELVGMVEGRIVFQSKDLGEYIFSTLKSHYRNHLHEALIQADRTLQKYAEMRDFGRCLEVSSVILENLTKEEIVDQSIKMNISSLLLQTTVCGQDYYQAENNEQSGRRLHANDGTRFLASKDVGRRVMAHYLEVCDVLIQAGSVSLKSTGTAGEIAKYYLLYNRELN